MEFSPLQVVLFVLMNTWLGIEAITTETNVDTLKPTVIRSPAVSDPEDGFGWTALFHEVEVVQETDTMDEALRKTRCLLARLQKLLISSWLMSLYC